MNMKDKFHYIVVGGGIVGLSTAWQLIQRYPTKKILLIEKEDDYARHQTGHNSGVIHAGVYYQPGSLKAKFCKEGVEKTIGFCIEHNIPYEQCGKLLVATSELEQQRMQALYIRCQENGIGAELLNEKELKEKEPHITGMGAIEVKTTGIVDFTMICKKMAELFQAAGGAIKLGEAIIDITEEDASILLLTNVSRYEGEFIICCAGLMADRLVKMHGLDCDFQIIPFRGEYYRLPPEKSELIQHLIYPIPDPDLPFLGVHLTRMIDGSITVGPNAVLGFKREGYGSINFNIKDVVDMIQFAGFWKVLLNNFRSGVIEVINSWWKQGYLKRVQKYCPQLSIADLQPYPAGIRAQAVLKDGSLVHDFLFVQSKRSLHVCNAPSPAATAAIPIGNFICEKVSELGESL
jgi:L-2-hydroxyglutarate oxidase